MKFKKIILGVFVFGLIVTCMPIQSISANEGEQDDVITLKEVIEKDPELFATIKKVKEYFVLDGEYLELNDSIESIAQKEMLNSVQVEKLNNLLLNQQRSIEEGYTKPKGRMHIYNNYLCMTYGDLIDFFGVAGSVSAGAVVALFTAAGSMVPLAGNFVTGVVGLFGGVYIASKITEAILENKGIAFSAIPIEIVLFQGNHPGVG